LSIPDAAAGPARAGIGCPDLQPPWRFHPFLRNSWIRRPWLREVVARVAYMPSVSSLT